MKTLPSHPKILIELLLTVEQMDASLRRDDGNRYQHKKSCPASAMYYALKQHRMERQHRRFPANKTPLVIRLRIAGWAASKGLKFFADQFFTDFCNLKSFFVRIIIGFG